jgi:hypothetical protein
VDRLVIETKEDWEMLERIIGEQIRGHMKSMEARGFRIIRNLTAVPGYNNWQAMLERCRNPKKESWAHYGGRGIKVCDRWQDFGKFIEDMGERPSPEYSLERINNDGNYEPKNCRWATWTEQARNQRQTMYATVDGEKKTLKEWSEITGIKYGTIYMRIVSWGWSPEKAIKTKLHGRWKRRASNDRRRALAEGEGNRKGRKRKAGDKAALSPREVEGES